MDPKRGFWLAGAAAPASKAKQLGISVATLKTMYKREWEDGTGSSAGAAPTRSQPGRASARTNPRYPNHDGTRFLDLSSDEDEDVVGSGSEWEYEGSDEEDDLELSPSTGRVLTAPERLVKHGTVARGAASCLPCLAEAEAFNITDVDGGQPTGMLYSECRNDIEAEKTVVRYKVFKGLVGANKGGISGKYTEWHINGVGVLKALAYRESMKEYEPSPASSTLRGFVISTCEKLERFLGLADFSSRCFGQVFFAPAGTGFAYIRHCVVKFWVNEVVPTAWETGLLSILAKKGDLIKHGNYRGIKMLEAFYKIASNILLARLNPIKEAQLEHNSQNGFRSLRGCFNSIFTVKQVIKKRSFTHPLTFDGADLSNIEMHGELFMHVAESAKQLGNFAARACNDSCDVS
eukprot:jgi/Tetstr1/456868/TSEL_043540.t1